MSDGENRKVSLPPHVRAMLDPYRRVVGKDIRPQDEPTDVYASMVPAHDRPSEQQLQAIGRVATTFSLLERALGFTLGRLSLAPDFPAMSLTKEIGVNFSLRAMEKLLALHHERYIGQLIPSDLLAALENMPAQIRPLKDERDIVVHTVWLRSGKDSLRGLRSRPLTASASTQTEASEYSLPELNALADTIQSTADGLFVLGQLLPEVDENSHVESLSRKALHRRPRGE